MAVTPSLLLDGKAGEWGGSCGAADEGDVRAVESGDKRE